MKWTHKYTGPDTKWGLKNGAQGFIRGGGGGQGGCTFVTAQGRFTVHRDRLEKLKGTNG